MSSGVHTIKFGRGSGDYNSAMTQKEENWKNPEGMQYNLTWGHKMLLAMGVYYTV